MDFDDPNVRAQAPWVIDPDCLARLETIVLSLDATIVISSTWRILHDREWMEQILGPLIGPRIHNDWRTSIEQREKIRGLEVQNWIEKNVEDPWNFKDYIILDDDKDFLWYQPLIWIDRSKGLTDNHVDFILNQHGFRPLPKEISKQDLTDFKDILVDRGIIIPGRERDVRHAVYDAYHCLVEKYSCLHKS
jgi:hypothetical protein